MASIRMCVGFAVLFATACSEVPASGPTVGTEYGDPLPDLDAAERARFDAGMAAFDRVYVPADGLGPFFNENQCSACHTSPATGGTGEQSVVRVSRFGPPARCDLLSGEGGENVQRNTIPQLRALGIASRTEPPHGERGLLRVPFLFGLGLVEAIPERAILEHADSADRDRDGISGRPGRDRLGRLARFGRKAEHATLESFTADALFNEMGLTSSVHPAEPLLEGEPLPDGVDPMADPETPDSTIARLADFIRFLAPPPGQPAPDAETSQWIAQGEALFAQLGCARCHVPEMRTAPALRGAAIRLYSDLLLHDMGPGLSGFCGIGASPSEWRTEPLMGLGRRERFLHDGRAYDLFAAIRLHGGEATAARTAFDALDRVTQEAVIRFLRSL